MLFTCDNLIISGIHFTEQSCNNKVFIKTQIFPSKVKRDPLFLIFLKIKWFELEQDFSLSTSTKGKRSSV